MQLSPESVARASSRHPWRTVVAWLAILVTGGILSSMLLADALTTDIDFTNEPESKRAAELLEERITGPEQPSEILIVGSGEYTVNDPEFQAHVGELQEAVIGLGDKTVLGATNYFETNDPTMVSKDQQTILMPVTMAGTIDDASEHVEDLRGVVRESNSDPAFETLVFGNASMTEDFTAVSEDDLRKGETIGIAVALVVLLIVFAAVVAGVIPIIMGMFAIAVAMGIVALLGLAFDFTFFVSSMISMMGLAVGIDYSLFVVSRYREERRRGRDKLDAIGAAGATANRAVFFSGLTVVLALMGMLIIPTTIFRSLASGAIIVVVVSVLASMTLLPAVLALLGDRINWPPLAKRARTNGGSHEGGFWDRVTRGVMRHPVVALVITAAALVAFAMPYFFQTQPGDDGRGIKTGMSGIATAPDSMPTKQAFLVLAEKFSGGLNAPVEIVIDGDVMSIEVQAGSDDLKRTLGADPGFGPAGDLLPNEAGDAAVLQVPLAGDPGSEASIAAIQRLRDDYVPRSLGDTGAEVLVGGQTAMEKDFFDMTDRYTPFIFVLVLSLSFLLLTVVFRSIVVPIKAIIMNLLSVGAAYGLIVLVFQQGGPGFGKAIADFFGFQQVSTIEAWLPLFLFSILFGLSMDYHVFLLTRIREQFDKTGDNGESVAFGLRTTAAIITGAALIMVAVFGGFSAGELVMMQQMGFGLAVAIFLDASIVRSILVPSTMKLLGDRNWYLPRWLRWLPDLEVEGHRAGVVVPDSPGVVHAEERV